MKEIFALHTWQQYARSLSHTVQDHYVLAVLLYLVGYALIVVSGIPLFIPFTLLAGYFFGMWYGLLYATIAANSGAVISFLLTRYMLRRYIMHRYAAQLAAFKRHSKNREYLVMLFLHLSMIVPYILINSVAALSDMSLATFVWTTLVGSFPMIFFTVFAGQQLLLMTTTAGIVPSGVWLFLLMTIVLSVIIVIIRRQIGSFGKE